MAEKKRNNPGDFKPGHQLWRNRKDPCKPLRFKAPDDLRDACISYFEWCDANPYQEEKLFQYQGVVVKDSISKMRMPTSQGMCTHIGICVQTWYQYGKRPKYDKVIDWASAVMHDWKLTAAAAGMLDGALVGRHLGIADKHDHSSSDGTMTPPKVIKLVPKKA